VTGLVAWLGTPVGRFVRDLVEGAIAGAVAAVVALQLDVATPQVILVAALTGAIAAAIAVARRAIVNAVSPGRNREARSAEVTSRARPRTRRDAIETRAARSSEDCAPGCRAGRYQPRAEATPGS